MSEWMVISIEWIYNKLIVTFAYNIYCLHSQFIMPLEHICLLYN